MTGWAGNLGVLKKPRKISPAQPAHGNPPEKNRFTTVIRPSDLQRTLRTGARRRPVSAWEAAVEGYLKTHYAEQAPARCRSLKLIHFCSHKLTHLQKSCSGN
jgi:hypothetical protein